MTQNGPLLCSSQKRNEHLGFGHGMGLYGGSAVLVSAAQALGFAEAECHKKAMANVHARAMEGLECAACCDSSREFHLPCRTCLCASPHLCDQ